MGYKANHQYYQELGWLKRINFLYRQSNHLQNSPISGRLFDTAKRSSEAIPIVKSNSSNMFH
jgi:hypothetical protein